MYCVVWIKAALHITFMYRMYFVLICAILPWYEACSYQLHSWGIAAASLPKFVSQLILRTDLNLLKEKLKTAGLNSVLILLSVGLWTIEIIFPATPYSCVSDDMGLSSTSTWRPRDETELSDIPDSWHNWVCFLTSIILFLHFLAFKKTVVWVNR